MLSLLASSRAVPQALTWHRRDPVGSVEDYFGTHPRRVSINKPLRLSLPASDQFPSLALALKRMYTCWPSQTEPLPCSWFREHQQSEVNYPPFQWRHGAFCYDTCSVAYYPIGVNSTCSCRSVKRIMVCLDNRLNSQICGSKADCPAILLLGPSTWIRPRKSFCSNYMNQLPSSNNIKFANHPSMTPESRQNSKADWK